MSVSGISSSNFLANFNPAAAQNKFQQIQKDFQQLGQDLQSGNLSGAQSDFATLQQDLQQQGGVSSRRFHHHHGGPILENSQGGQNSPTTLFGELGQELQSGSLTAAQQTYTSLQQDFLQFIGGNGSTASTSTSASTAASSLNISA